MSVLVFDTETTGLPQWRLSPDDPRQPRLVQLAASLFDEAGQRQASFACLICPDGTEWTISPEAAAIHGISTERCRRYGVLVGQALEALSELGKRASVVVAHNLDFDTLILRAECSRQTYLKYPLLTHRAFCTMRAATPILQLPGRKPGEFKWPSLAEAHRFFCGCDFAGAHDALADVEACARVYFEMLKRIPEAA